MIKSDVHKLKLYTVVILLIRLFKIGWTLLFKSIIDTNLTYTLDTYKVVYLN